MRRKTAFIIAISLPLFSLYPVAASLALADPDLCLCLEPGAPMSLVETPDETLEELPGADSTTKLQSVPNKPGATSAGATPAPATAAPAPSEPGTAPTPVAPSAPTASPPQATPPARLEQAGAGSVNGGATITTITTGAVSPPVSDTAPAMPATPAPAVTAATGQTGSTTAPETSANRIQSPPAAPSIGTVSEPTESTPLQQRKPRAASEASEVEIENPLQENSEFNKTYPPDAPYALVSIRFPAEYSPNFVRNLNRLKMFRRDTLSTIRSYVDEQILKSAYYATEFYNYCSSRLPADSVIMEPMKIGFTTKGKVITLPIRQGIPALVTIDMFSSINADRVRVPNSGTKQKDTFAEYVNIVANIQKATKDGYIAVAGLPIKSENHYGMDIADFYNTIGESVEPHYETRIGELPVSQKGPPKPDSFCELKTVFKCATKSIAEPERLIDGQGNAPCTPIWAQFNSIITTTLRSQNFADLQPYLMASYVEDIDPEISELLAHGAKINHTAGLTRRKMELLSRYMDNERRQIFSLEAQRTEQSLYSGELGDSVRSIAKSELEYLKHRSASKRRQYAESLIGLAAGAGSLAASVGMQTPAFGNLLTTVSFASVGMIQNESRVQQKLRDTFQQFERQSTDLQTTFMLKFGNDALEVSGNNLDELRAKFKQKYQERFEAFSMIGSTHDSN